MTSRTMRSLVAAIAVVLILPAFAFAAWNSNGSGKGYAKATSVAAGNTPTATVSGRNVAISWTPTGGSVPVSGYIVKRYSTGGAEQTIGANCSGTVSGTSCTENAVPAGNWKYSVTPARQNWRGNESAQSSTVTVNAPALSLSPNTVTSLPQVLTGQITNFVAGQTVTFRLDNQTTGTVLIGSITPSPVPASGTAAVSVTLPAGVSNGSHTIFAIGSGSDVASTSVAVAIPTTITTSAYDFDDANGAETVRNEPNSIAGDGVTQASTTWATAFAANRFVEYTMNSPLRPGQTVSSANFNFRYAGGNIASPSCFYVEVRNGAGTVLSTHGSATTPFGCVTGTTQTNFTVPIPAVDTTTKANDLVIRIYGRTQTLATTFTVDRATVSGTSTDGNFELFPNSSNDAADSTPATLPWSLFADDNTVFTNSASWGTTYTATRYLKATFPGYVPSGSSNISATLTHIYRSSTAGRPVCNYVEILDGSSVIGTHGSTSSDLSCALTTTEVTDTIPLPEVDTVAEANALSAKIYMRRTGSTTTSTHDQVRLSVSYVK
jgi:hypothetical protein